MRGVVPEALASRKLVVGDDSSEGRLEEGKSSYRGRSLSSKSNEKSAEVIVITENEPASDRNPESRRSHERNEGLNVKKFLMRHGFSAMK